MRQLFAPSCLAVSVMLSLSGCNSSEITMVKKATVPEDQTHTYETSFSARASCDSEEWRTFKDESNRKGVEYRCVLKNAPELIAATRVRKIDEVTREFRNYVAALDERIEEAKQAPAIAAKFAAEAQEKLAQEEANEEKTNQQFANEDPVTALKRAAIRNEIGVLASARSIAERSKQSASDTQSSLESNVASLQNERDRFEKNGKDALASIEKSHGGITKATEVFQWLVKDGEIYPTWAGIEFQKEEGTIIRANKNWSIHMRHLLSNRGEDHVRYALNVPNDVILGN